MKALRFWCLGSSLVIALTVGTYVTAQEKKAEPAKAAEKKEEETVEDERFRIKAVAAGDDGTILFTDHDNQRLYCSKSGNQQATSRS